MKNTQLRGARAVAACALAVAAVGFAQDRPRLAVKEITVFKNGYGLIVAEGELPVGVDGHATYDSLPQVALGTFWPSVVAGGPKLESAVVERRPVRVERTVLDFRGLLLANVGAEIYVTEPGLSRYAATIVGVLERAPEEIERTGPPDQPPAPPVRGNVALLKTSEGVRPVSFDRMNDMTYRLPPKTVLEESEMRDVVTWRLDWSNTARTTTAKVRLAYVQKGLRWQPSYRIELDGAGAAKAVLAATLVNDLVDLDGAAVNFVVGAPRLDFADEIDAVVLDAALRQTSQQAARQYDFASNRLANFSNSAQVMGSFDRDAGVEAPFTESADLTGARAEDLYVFATPSVTLRRGARLVVRVAEWKLGSKDVYKLELKANPPREVADQTNANRRSELAKLLAAPKVVHYLRLTNEGPHPLTTGPAAIFKDGRLLGQALLTYTAIGGTSDLAMADAVEIRVRREDKQTSLENGVVAFGYHNYTKVSFDGEVLLTNFSGKTVDLEVTREVFGILGAVQDGEGRQLEPGEAIEATTGSRGYGGWGWSWPWWWHATNGLGRATWKLTLEPGKAATLKNSWAYYWR